MTRFRETRGIEQGEGAKSEQVGGRRPGGEASVLEPYVSEPTGRGRRDAMLWSALVAFEAAEVTDQEQMLQVPAHCRQALQVLDRLPAAGLASRAKCRAHE